MLQDTQLRESCPRCLGSGWLVVEEDGRRRAVRCGCHRERMVGRLLEAASFPRRYEHCTLDSYRPRNANQREALARTRRFVEAFPAVEKGLMYLGPCGVGKTHLAVAAVRELVVSKGVSAVFADYLGLLKRIQGTYDPLSQTTEREVLRSVQEAEVLLLDDLGGARPLTPWVQDTLFHILNSRYNDRAAILITSNYPDIPFDRHDPKAREFVRDDSLGDRIGGRLRSRLYEMCDAVEMDGGDYRAEAGSRLVR